MDIRDKTLKQKQESKNKKIFFNMDLQDRQDKK
jgi:hypothetical protein